MPMLTHSNHENYFFLTSNLNPPSSNLSSLLLLLAPLNMKNRLFYSFLLRPFTDSTDKQILHRSWRGLCAPTRCKSLSYSSCSDWQQVWTGAAPLPGLQIDITVLLWGPMCLCISYLCYQSQDRSSHLSYRSQRYKIKSRVAVIESW